MLCFTNSSEYGPLEIKRQNELLKLLREEMVRCLIYQYGADETDANDATQETMYVLIRLFSQNDVEGIRTKKSYIFAILKHQYFKLLRERVRMTGESIELYENKLVAMESDSYTEREARNLLKNCISKLTEKHQTYVRYWIENEKASASDFSARFDVTLTNAWTIKHRLIAILEKCVDRHYAMIDDSRQKV